jgi:hypothetical protein
MTMVLQRGHIFIAAMKRLEESNQKEGIYVKGLSKEMERLITSGHGTCHAVILLRSPGWD